MIKVKRQEKNYYILATAHVSSKSVQEVQRAIETIPFDAIAIELDAQRALGTNQKETKKFSKEKLLQTIKDKSLQRQALQFLLAYFQQNIAQDLQVEAGAEMFKAIELGKKAKIPVYYIDRDLQITFKRLQEQIRPKEKILLTLSLLKKEENPDIENLKDPKTIKELIQDMEAHFPSLAQVILHERNQYMAQRLRNMNFQNILVVIGAAHEEGLIQALDQEHQLSKLQQTQVQKKKKLPVKSLLFIFFSLVLYFFFPQKTKTGLAFFLKINLSSNLLLGLILKINPLANLINAIFSPLTLFLPKINAAMLAGLSQAAIGEIHAQDFNKLKQDFKSLKGAYQNKVILLVLFMITSQISQIISLIAALIKA